MHVVIITDFAYINGGSGKVAIESAVGLAKRGDSVHVFAAYGPIGTELQNAPEIDVTVVNPGEFKKQLGVKDIPKTIWDGNSAQALSALLAKLDKSQTVIHIHSFKDAHSPSVCKIAKKSGFKVVYTAHDYTMFCPYVGFFDLAGFKVCDRKPMSLSCLTYNCQGTSLVRKQVQVAKFAALTNLTGYPEAVDHLICVGDHSRNVVEKYLKREVNKSVVEYPISVTKGDRIAAEDNQVFGFVGRLSLEKDPVTAARAAKIAGVPIRFVGEGPMADQVREANPDAEITGWIPGSEMPKQMAQLRCNLLPSVWLETRGLGILEGAATGIPCIVSEVCAASQTVGDLKCGFTHKPADADHLAEQMTKMKDDSVVKQFSENGYGLYWENPLTMDRHLDGIQKIYQQVLSKS